MTKEKFKKAIDVIGIPRLIVFLFFAAVVLTAYVNGINVVNDIYSIDRTIVVVSDVAQTCTVTTAAGMTESYALAQGYNEIMVANAGMYIVSTGNMIKKLIVK